MPIRGLPALLAVAFAGFGGWALLLPIVPLALSQAGESDAIAGASTAVFMGATVITQLLTPRALRAWGYRRVLAIGCVLLGPPSLVFVATLDPVPTLAISAVRGVGFGFLTVAAGAMVAELAPARLLGRATAWLGIASAAAQFVTLPLGVVLEKTVGTGAVFTAGAVVPVVAVVFVVMLPAVQPARPARSQRPDRLPFAPVFGPILAMIVVSAAFGGFSSLLPIAVEDAATAAAVALAVLSGAITIGRYVGGELTDRLGAGRLLVPSLLVAVAGQAVLALSVRGEASIALIVVGALMLGLGFGLCQTDSMIIVFNAGGPTGRGAASAIWNAAYDGGTGVGALGLGVVATFMGYPLVFGLAALAIAAAVPFTLNR